MQVFKDVSNHFFWATMYKDNGDITRVLLNVFVNYRQDSVV